MSEKFEDICLFDSLFDEICESTIGTEFNKDVDTVIIFLEAVVTHDVGMDDSGECFKGLYLSLVALSLHGFDGDDWLSFGGVPSEDLSKGSFS